jgi:UDP-glucose 4-epimerase
MKLENKSIMVTGGAGFIGSHLVDRLIKERPCRLVVVDNLFLGKEANLRESRNGFPALEFIKQDAADEDRMQEIIKSREIEVVFNLAVVPLPTSLVQPKWVYEQNVGITMSLCELMRKGVFPTMVHFSSSEAYGDLIYAPIDERHPMNTTTTYGASKAACDMLVQTYCRLYGVNVYIVRPFNNYGPRQNEGGYAGVIPVTIKRILEHESPVIYGDGLQTRDFTYVGDTVEAAVRILGCPDARNRIVNVASGNEIEIKRLVKMISDYMGCDSGPVYLPERSGDLRRLLGSCDLLHSLTGYKPHTDFEEGLNKTVDWYIQALS